jgi:hypothetical protein
MLTGSTAQHSMLGCCPRKVNRTRTPSAAPAEIRHTPLSASLVCQPHPLRWRYCCTNNSSTRSPSHPTLAAPPSLTPKRTALHPHPVLPLPLCCDAVHPSAILHSKPLLLQASLLSHTPPLLCCTPSATPRSRPSAAVALTTPPYFLSHRPACCCAVSLPAVALPACYCAEDVRNTLIHPFAVAHPPLPNPSPSTNPYCSAPPSSPDGCDLAAVPPLC